MRKIIAHDTVNDVALIKIGSHYHVRYGVETAEHYSLSTAASAFASCVAHAVAAEGLDVSC